LGAIYTNRETCRIPACLSHELIESKIEYGTEFQFEYFIVHLKSGLLKQIMKSILHQSASNLYSTGVPFTWLDGSCSILSNFPSKKILVKHRFELSDQSRTGGSHTWTPLFFGTVGSVLTFVLSTQLTRVAKNRFDDREPDRPSPWVGTAATQKTWSDFCRVFLFCRRV